MNGMELKFARMRKGFSQREMACIIRRSLDSYSKKERGEVSFFPDEIVAATQKLELSFDQFNNIFFDGDLPFRNLESMSI